MTSTTKERRRHRRTIVKFLLASIAVLGIGAAATSAAWTDQAWFTGTATAASIQLQGSANGTTWIDADDQTGAVAVPASFTNLIPGQTRVVTLHLRNNGSTPLVVSQTALTTSGSLFAGSAPATATSNFTMSTIAASGTTTFTLTVTTPSTWPTTYQSATGGIVLTFTGSTS